jgi:hypothetical protein
MPRGPKFDNVVEQVFALQLTGRGKTPEEREKILRKITGIKEQPKKKEKEKKPSKGTDKAHAAAAMGDAAKHKHAAAKADAKHAAKGKPSTAKPAAKHHAPAPGRKNAPASKKRHSRK